MVDGLRFHSAGEARRWGELQLLKKAGAIDSLQRQVSYELHAIGPDGLITVLGTWRADFQYWRMTKNGAEFVVEDFKGFEVPLQRWKRRHVEAQYGITVTVVRR
jgi:hypothetical protein